MLPRTEENVRSPDVLVTNGCDPPYVGAGNKKVVIVIQNI